MAGLERYRDRFAPLLVAALVAALVAGWAVPALAQLAAPQPGAVNKWVCTTTGTAAKSYATKILALEDGLLRIEDQVDREIGSLEIPAQLYGLTLYTQRLLPEDGGVRRQIFDPEDFAAYPAMAPGTEISADVRETDGSESWTWRYSVEIGEPFPIEHELLGTVTVTPVSEERWIYRQTVGTSLKFLIVPETAQIVKWTSKSAEGTQDCDLYLSFKKKIKNAPQ